MSQLAVPNVHRILFVKLFRLQPLLDFDIGPTIGQRGRFRLGGLTSRLCVGQHATPGIEQTHRLVGSCGNTERLGAKLMDGALEEVLSRGDFGGGLSRRHDRLLGATRNSPQQQSTGNQDRSMSNFHDDGFYSMRYVYGLNWNGKRTKAIDRLLGVNLLLRIA